MVDVPLDLDPAMVDNMRREADDHGFDDLDGYVQWLLQHRDTVLNEHDVWNAPPGGVADPEADLSQSSGPSLDPDLGDGGEEATLEPDEPTDEADDVDLPEDEEGADDDDVAAALEEIELEDEDE